MSIEYFGANRQLLGALHQPQRLRPRSTAVLLCNPFGEEASRAHRTFRVLATQLERAGLACLRFDYSGTGDSLGDSADAGIEDWIGDIAIAADRLRATGATRIAAVGLRLGATLAMLASARGAARLRHILLWDPVVDGAAYVQELLAQHRAYMRGELDQDWEDHQQVSADGMPSEALGAPIGPELGRQLAAIDLTAIAPAAEHHTVLTTRTTREIERLRPRMPAKTRWLEMSESAAWNSDAALNAMTVPMDIVHALVARIEELSP